jgi:hypothetical protein
MTNKSNMSFVICHSSFVICHSLPIPMTRELLFTTSFETEFASATGWKSMLAIQGGPLAASDLPAFGLTPGEATYTAYDATGNPASGTQAFSIRIIFAHAQLAVASALATRSDYIGQVESFFSGGYTPPVVSLGDPARIDGILLKSVDPPLLNKIDTRSAITIHASYFFTML